MQENGMKLIPASLRRPGYPWWTRGFASPNCSGFAFIGDAL